MPDSDFFKVFFSRSIAGVLVLGVLCMGAPAQALATSQTFFKPTTGQISIPPLNSNNSRSIIIKTPQNTSGKINDGIGLKNNSAKNPETTPPNFSFGGGQPSGHGAGGSWAIGESDTDAVKELREGTVGQITEVGVGFIPVAGEVNDATECVRGEETVTGNKMVLWEQGVTCTAFFIPVVGGVVVRKGLGIIGDGLKWLVRKAGDAINVVFKNSDEAVDVVQEVSSKAVKYSDIPLKPGRMSPRFVKDNLHKVTGEVDGVKRPQVSDPVLQKNYINELYRKGAVYGDGGTADAIRHTKQTGEPVGLSDHIQKGEDMVRGLRGWLEKNPKASLDDRKVAELLIEDLENALSGK